MDVVTWRVSTHLKNKSNDKDSNISDNVFASQDLKELLRRKKG